MSGGAMSQMAIFALGIGPYISASIIMSLATVMFPQLERIQKKVSQVVKNLHKSLDMEPF